MKQLNRHRLLTLALQAVVMLLMLGLTFDAWCPSSVRVSVALTSVYRFTAQVYYATQKNENFSEASSSMALVRAGDSRLDMDLPIRQLKRFRFDLGMAPGTVTIKNIAISGLPLDLSKFIPSSDIKIHQLTGEGLVLSFSGKDPHLVYQGTLPEVEGRRTICNPGLLPLLVLFMIWLSRFVARVLMGWVSGFRTWWRCTACTDGDVARIVALDVLRVVAFLFVVFAHVQVQVHQQTLPDWMNVHNFYWGGLGVMIFFFISGVSLSVRSFDRLKTQGCLSFYVSRLRAVLPSYWVAYFISCLLFFACFGVQRMGGDFMTILQTVFAVDGYLANRIMTYNLVGDWYVGCILLLYLIAPFVYWMCKRRPVVALVASFLVALMGLWASQYLTEQTIWWNKDAIFNMPVHLFEFTAGIVFFMYVRQSRRMFLGAALFSMGYCILYCFIPHGPHFSNSALGIPAAVCLCLALCFLLTFVRYSNGVEDVIGWLARNSFLAFLYHHFLIYKVLPSAPCTEPRQFVYDCVLIATLSYALAWISEKPVAAIRKMVFGR